MIKRKRYSKEFKEKLVLEILSSQSSPTQVSKREGIAPATLRAWQDDFAKGGFQSRDQSEATLRQRVVHLESAVSELALENHILKKAQKLLQEYQQRERSSNSILRPSSG